MPVAEFSGDRGWGYDGVDLFAPHHAYGGPDGLKRLVDAAHARGLGVLLDVVYNHLGPAGNYLREFGPYFTTRYRTPWGEAVNFDGEDSDEVRRFVIDNALMWLRDYHVDGLRIDAVHAIFDTSATHILAELAAEVRALAAHLGRAPDRDRRERPERPAAGQRSPAAGGYGLDSCWADDWHHALHAVLTGERDGYYGDFGSLPVLAKALRQAWVHDGSYSAFRRRVHGRSPAGLPAARVRRLHAEPRPGRQPRGSASGLAVLAATARLRIAAALLLTAPFVPMLFQGEEWGATIAVSLLHRPRRSGARARPCRQGRQAEFAAFGWDPDAIPDPQAAGDVRAGEAGLGAGWSGDGHAQLLSWYRTLIRLRRQYQALSDPRFERVETECDAKAGWLTVRRGPLLVAVNLGSAGLDLPDRW